MNDFMQTNEHEYLFPHRLTRRDFLKMTGATAVAAATPGLLFAEEAQTPLRIGSGAYTYETVDGWGKLPAGMKYGLAE